ncbi:MAG: IS1634 family transposase, partial [Merismopedia sp. SIO2A8]|nr:IS1634 family transposase [Merismopedia sp. SIO2A8]
RVLDGLYLSGLSETFMLCCMKASQTVGLECKSAHLDSTSFSLSGAYERGSEDWVVEGAPVPISITHGYSRDHRPDLKQWMMNLVCWDDGAIPAFIEMADGNQSDKVRFGGLMQEFKQQWSFDGLYVSDGALYSADNLALLTGLEWLTRVPLTNKVASTVVEELSEDDFIDLDVEGYRFATVCTQYGEVPQRWFVIESEARWQSDLKRWRKTLKASERSAQLEWKTLCSVSFACEADAIKAAQRVSHTWSWHRLEYLSVEPHPHYDKPGKPKADAVPGHISYHLKAEIVQDKRAVATRQQRAGRFILATNRLGDEHLNPAEALATYKKQQGNVRIALPSAIRGFGFLKDPLFFTSSVFLKSPERIMALGLVMGLCLLVYTLGERQLRQVLVQTQQTLPNQLGKPTQRPTLRWIFQQFMAVHLVTLNGVKQITNLTPLRQRILRFMGASCQKYYLMT